jgi:VWFA-related protein
MLNFLIKIVFPGLFVFCLSNIAFAQDAQKTPVPQPTVENEEEVLEIRTNLIQTGVMVFDKNGRQIDGLKQEDFELKVDGKPVSLSFFEKLTAVKKAANEEKQESTQTDKKQEVSTVAPVSSTGRGRNVIFVVDDVHLSSENTVRSRRLVNKFIDQDMLPDDTVAIVSTSGKIGFLQQFTNNKSVLKAAAEKIIYSRSYSANDRMLPPMSEYEALLISQWDKEVTDLFVTLDPSPSPAESKIETIRTRARGILSMASAVSRMTYSVLEQVVRSSASLPGRKIVFFVSDGFVSDPMNSDYSTRIRRITDAASRSNTVIYTYDARGLEAGFPEEGSTTSSQRLAFRTQSGERFELQTGLSELADSTGGKFIRNTNDMQSELGKSLEEASTYYLLAWEPDEDTELKSGKSSQSLRKIEVAVKARPELKVRFQNGYLTGAVAEENKEEKSRENTKKGKNSQPEISPVNKQLNDAISRQGSLKDLPTLLAVNYLDSPNDGNLITAALQINDSSTAEIDILGVLYDSEGKQQDFFRKLMTVNLPLSKTTEKKNSKIYYNYQTKVKPGLYQLRVATRDVKSGRVGSTNQWIEIPDISSKKLSLSSILLGEVADSKLSQGSNKTSVLDGVQLSVDRQFERSSTIRYLIFAYNSSKNVSPDLTIQTRVMQNGKAVLETPVRKLSTEGQDPLRLAYAAEIPLNSLITGKYVLDVSVQDRSSKETSSRQIDFEVR